MKKKIFFITPLLLILALPMVSAALIPKVISDSIEKLFSGIPEPWKIKFALFWFVFATGYAVLSKVESLQAKGGGKGPAITIAIVIAAITTMAIPDESATLIFSLYSGLFSFIIIMLPFGALVYFMFKAKNKSPVTHAALALGLGTILALTSLSTFQNLIPSIGLSSDFTWNDLIGIFQLILFILLAIEIVNIFSSYDRATHKYGVKAQGELSDGELAKLKADDDVLKAEAKQRKYEAKQMNKNLKKGQKIINRLSSYTGLNDSALKSDKALLTEIDKIIDMLKYAESFEPSTEPQRVAAQNAQKQISNSLSKIYGIQSTNNNIKQFEDLLKEYQMLDDQIVKELQDETKRTKKLEDAHRNHIAKLQKNPDFQHSKIEANEEKIEQHLKDYYKKIVELVNLYIINHENLINTHREFSEANRAGLEHLNQAQVNLRNLKYPDCLNNLADFKNQKLKEIKKLEELRPIIERLKQLHRLMTTMEDDYVRSLDALINGYDSEVKELSSKNKAIIGTTPRT